MIDELTSTAKQIGDEIIDMTALLDKKMDKWSDVADHPDNLLPTECVGFISKETTAPGLNLLIDIQAPASKDKATLRTWVIESQLDNGHNERFNNIQLGFTVNLRKARELTKESAHVTRDDIRTVLHDQDTKLTRLVVSNQSGLDKVSQQQLGERYDLALGQHADTTQIDSTLHTVLLELQKSAAAEANS